MKTPPDTEFAAAMAVADEAMRPILGAHAVWAEEAARVGAPPLTWPPQIRMAAAGDHAGLMTALAVAAVETVLCTMLEAEAGEPVPEDPRWRAQLSDIVDQLDPADPEVQIVLRVVERAVRAADLALCDKFGGRRGAHRLSGKREWINWMKAREVGAVVRSGLPRAEALRALGMSRAAAYRAMKRR